MSLQTNNKTKMNYNFASWLAFALLMGSSQYLSADVSSAGSEIVDDEDDEDDEDDVKESAKQVKDVVTPDFLKSDSKETKPLSGWRYKVGNNAFLVCTGTTLVGMGLGALAFWGISKINYNYVAK